MPGEVWAVIAAAGGSRRMQGINKLYLPLGGRVVLARTVGLFEACAEITGIILAVAAGEIARCKEEIIGPWNLTKVAAVVPGGATRQDSVAAALAVLPPAAELVVVHDGARPFLRAGLLEQAILTARKAGAAVVAVPVKDTVKMVVLREGWPEGVEQTLPRDRVWAAQSPQVFARELLTEAYTRARQDGFLATDDSSLVERLGHPVAIVPGDYTNIKITVPEDVYMAEALLAAGVVDGEQAGK